MNSILRVSGSVVWLVSMLIYIPFDGAPKVATREFAWVLQGIGLFLVAASLFVRSSGPNRRLDRE